MFTLIIIQFAIHFTYRNISFLIIKHSYQSECSAIMVDEKAREVAITLSQNLISLQKGIALRRGRQ
jgi:hypothetical protein